MTGFFDRGLNNPFTQFYYRFAHKTEMKSVVFSILLAAVAQVAMAQNYMAVCYSGRVESDDCRTDRRVLREKEGRRLNDVCGSLCAGFDEYTACMEYGCGVDNTGKPCEGELGDEMGVGATDGILELARKHFMALAADDSCIDSSEDAVQCFCADQDAAVDMKQ